MKYAAILFAVLPALALAEGESTTTCTSTTTMTKTVTLTNEYTTSVYAESTSTSASTNAEKPTVAAENPAKSNPSTVLTAGASSMYGEYNLAALAGVGIAVAALL